MTKKIIAIVGATCELGIELSKIYAKNNFDLIIISRNKEKNNNLKNLIKEKQKDTKVFSYELDILDLENQSKIYNKLNKPIEGVISLIGETHNIEKINDPMFLNITNINYSYLANFLTLFLEDFHKKNNGFLICVSSVAGLRGRGKNFIYGSAKAALISFLSGCRNYYKNTNLFIMTVLPGFISNQGSKLNKVEKFLSISPHLMANKIFLAQSQKKEILYSNFVWRLIMFTIKILPNSVFKKVKF